jgi:hypothetical protein
MTVMPPRSWLRRHARSAALTVLAVLAATSIAACSGKAFDPAGACTADGRAAGAYPDLERLVPLKFEDVAPSTLDSGRSCTQPGLGSLASHDVGELRFAGGQWQLGNRSGLTMAVLSSPTGLDAAWAGQFYETSARAAKHTENVSAEQTRIGDIDAFRVETLNDEASFQTVVVWPGPAAVNVVLVASDVHEVGSRATHDEVVERAVTSFASFDPG